MRANANGIAPSVDPRWSRAGSSAAAAYENGAAASEIVKPWAPRAWSARPCWASAGKGIGGRASAGRRAARLGRDRRRSPSLGAFDALDREGFVAVYPDAIDGRWSYGRPIILPMPSVKGETVDDAGFLRRLIAHLVERDIHRRRQGIRFAVSRGGLMAFTLACVLDDVIRGGAPVVTGMTDHQRDDCQPQRLVPIVAASPASHHHRAQWHPMAES